MKVKYFPDTDAAHVEFTTGEVRETKEISENIYVDIETVMDSTAKRKYIKKVKSVGSSPPQHPDQDEDYEE